MPVSPSLAPVGGKSGVSSAEELARPERARSGPAVGGTAWTVSVRVAPPKAKRTSYDRAGVSRFTVTSTVTFRGVPRATVRVLSGTRTSMPFGASAVSRPRTSSGRSEPRVSVSRRVAPMSASARPSGSVREADSSANQGTRCRTRAGSAPVTRTASIRRPSARSSVAPRSDSAPRRRHPSPGTRASTTPSVPGSVSTVTASIARASGRSSAWSPPVRAGGSWSMPAQLRYASCARLRNGSRTPSPTVTRADPPSSRSAPSLRYAAQAAPASPARCARSMSRAVVPASP